MEPMIQLMGAELQSMAETVVNIITPTIMSSVKTLPWFRLSNEEVEEGGEKTKVTSPSGLSAEDTGIDVSGFINDALLPAVQKAITAITSAELKHRRLIDGPVSAKELEKIGGDFLEYLLPNVIRATDSASATVKDEVNETAEAEGGAPGLHQEIRVGEFLVESLLPALTQAISEAVSTQIQARDKEKGPGRLGAKRKMEESDEQAEQEPKKKRNCPSVDVGAQSFTTGGNVQGQLIFIGINHVNSGNTPPRDTIHRGSRGSLE